jgi:hypothetical protein
VTTVENAHAGQGSVVLDIGADVGAVVVSTPTALAGAEIEICPAGHRGERPDEGHGWWSGEWRGHGHGHAHGPAWPHVGVLRRDTSAGVRYAAVFPGLRAGSYELWLRPAEPTAIVVAVLGGRVTEVGWPDGQGW